METLKKRMNTKIETVYPSELGGGLRIVDVEGDINDSE